VPLVVHVHSTEFDRSGVHVDQRIYDIERRGMHAAMKVIAVSYLTKNLITHHYGIDPGKVEVVYNAIESNGSAAFDPEQYSIHKDEKIVLFLGRITMQKGPEYFLAAAKRVLEVMDNVKFVMAGSGDMIRRTIELAASMGIGHKVLFTGFLRGSDVEKVFKMAEPLRHAQRQRALRHRPPGSHEPRCPRHHQQIIRRQRRSGARPERSTSGTSTRWPTRLWPSCAIRH